MSQSRAIILLSGGLDSATVLAMAKARGLDCHTVGFDYGQKHRSELKAARRIADALSDHPHKVIRIDLGSIGGSALTSDDIDVPITGVADDGIPVTYVPARNTVFLSIALGYGEVIGARHLFIGANAVDYSGYPDCRPAFIEQFESLANVATAAVDGGERWVIEAPLMTMSKSDIVTTGNALGVDYSMTVSCYQADEEGAACGACDACRLRRKGFLDAGLYDPTKYRRGISPKI
ncbi:MAG: 7-cyano-7-deazaguanine synthase QueC [Oceanospirillales bacterium TMED33]|nr:7-cyano-7-deazaguanine synthase QueC [Gammaproteobacteria bacterium]RPG19601.1 MAG: 7-cyano-7-deazaguanine synthase QueC [Oceanospirillales bacterium TMED33]CAI8346332.1 MAG: 7-cyano-7-deazaguanine synthase [Gammaproteobacteria bacterium]|tara:strand:- start:38 stop:739 length:702 start_codon:yes stop_codon:yes gene_type:complete